MPLGASRIAFLAKSATITVEPTVIRKKINISASGSTVSTSQSKFGGASAFFDGTNDMLVLNGGPGTDFSGDFTIEFFLYLDSLQTANILDWRGIHSSFEGGGTGTFALSNTLLIGHNSGDFRCWIDGSDRSTSGVVFSTGTWTHVAVQRSNGTFNAWVNGTRYVNYAGSDDYTNVLKANMPIGVNTSTTSRVSWLDGYIDEFRISTSARYTNGASITVPTESFVNDDDTYCLFHMDGTNASTHFEDDNGTGRAAKGVTAQGNAYIETSESKFGGASFYSDGATDYLQIADHADFDFGTGDFTLEAWVRPNPNITNGEAIISKWNGGLGYSWLFGYGPGGTDQSRNIRFGRNIGGYAFYNTTNNCLTDNAWNHVAAVRSNGTLYLYANGNLELTQSMSGDIYTSTTPVCIGAIYGGDFSPLGYIDEVRVSSVARYSGSSYTTPTEPFVNDDDTVLLVHCDGTDGSTDFRDDNGTGRASEGVSAIGNAQIDTAQSKFGGASALFDGTGDRLELSKPLIPASDDFTIECWCRVDTTGTNRSLVSQYTSSQVGRMALARQGSLNVFQYFQDNGSDDIILRSTTNPSTGVWYHVAVVRNGNDWALYINGTQEDTDTNTGSVYQGVNTWIGDYESSAYWDGHIDELRISDNARYTANFTAPTEPFQNDANTLLLLHMNGTDGDTTFIDDNGKH